MMASYLEKLEEILDELETQMMGCKDDSLKSSICYLMGYLRALIIAELGGKGRSKK